MTTHWSVGSAPTTTDAQPHAPCPHGNTGLYCQQCYEAGPYATIARLQARVQRLSDALFALTHAVDHAQSKPWCTTDIDTADAHAVMEETPA